MKGFIRFLLPALLSLVLGLNLTGQRSGNAVISGFVTDATTGEPLIGTNIAIMGTSLGTISDLNGAFFIPNIPVGSQTVAFRYIGYGTVNETLQLNDGETRELNVQLSPEAIMGEEVVVTIQARGQRAAINQQLAANNISNIVSSAKIREVPDVNAAESIGRLPGVSLRRSGGEGNQIVVRGLSPQYTIVEVDGVRLQGVGLGRDVGLSTISSEMLDGIELSKTLTPDKDADAIGGVVNLRTRTAESDLDFDLLAQGGYNGLENSFANYKFGANLGGRFFNDRFGVLASATTEQVWRSSDRYTAGYSEEFQPSGDTTEQGELIYDRNYYTQNENVREFRKLRHRHHGGLVLDFRNDFMDLRFNNTYSQMVDQNEQRQSQFLHGANDYRHIINDSEPDERIQAHSFSGLFRFLNTELNIDAQYSKTTLDSRNDSYRFDDLYSVEQLLVKNELLFAEPYQLLQRYDITSADQAYLEDNIRTHTMREDITQRVNLDWKIPFAISQGFSGHVQVGGSYGVKERSSDVEEYWSYYHGGIGGGRADVVFGLYPDFYHYTEPEYKPGKTMPGINFIDPDYEFGDVLKGIVGKDLGWTADLDFLKEVHDYFGVDEEGNPKFPADQTYGRGVQSSQNDYTNREEYLAGYAMMELMIGRRIMVLPGVRFEQLKTEYTANYLVENAFDPSGIQPGYPDTITVGDRVNQYFFPSLNVKVDITDWMDIRGAYYKSTSRPNYNLLSPGMVSNFDKDNITAYNPYLRPALAHNYDLGVSFFSNKLGLLTLNFFYKQLSDLLYRIPEYQNNYFDLANGVPESLMESFEAPRHLYREDLFNDVNGLARMNNFPVNNPNDATFVGFEVSWQTNFWYLPGLLSGLVLDLNYTFIRSETTYPYLDIYTTFTDDFPVPKKITNVDYATRKGVMLDQPNSIYNALIGWDYKGFSTRLSLRYQGESLQGLNPVSTNQDRFKKAHFRMDFMAKQSITKRISVQLDIQNLTNALDEYYMSASGYNLPNQIEYYGLTSRLSLRYVF